MKKLYTTEEVSKIVNCKKTYITTLIRRKNFKPKIARKGRNPSEFDIENILELRMIILFRSLGLPLDLVKFVLKGCEKHMHQGARIGLNYNEVIDLYTEKGTIYLKSFSKNNLKFKEIKTHKKLTDGIEVPGPYPIRMTINMTMIIEDLISRICRELNIPHLIQDKSGKKLILTN